MTAASYRVDGAAVTAEVFYRRACEPSRSAVVEACAGSGKTWILVSRILRALLDGAQPHEILAITFTRKAAGEMQQRLGDWLRDFADPGLPDERRRDALIQRGVAPEAAAALSPVLAGLHEQVLTAARGVRAQTFHAWFAQLLRAAPAELLEPMGLQRDMELIETLDDHWSALWRRFHAAVLADARLFDDFNALSAKRGRFMLRSWLESALERRVEIELADRAGVLAHGVARAADVWPELPPGMHPAQALRGAPWQARLRALALELGRGGLKAQRAAAELSQALAPAHDADPFSAAWSALFTLADEPRKLGNSPELAEVQDDLALVAAQCRQHEAHDEHQRMARLSLALFSAYAGYKRAHGYADMSDLESCAVAMLRDSSLAGWTQERLDVRYRHVLIDEFQDTSPPQWQALHAWLSSYAGAGGGASGQRAPSVFIVGDPKQSIYRFRRAEPRVFEAARRFVQTALDGVILENDHTRRNRPQLLGPLNAVFTQAAAQGEFSGFRLHTTALQEGPTAGVWALPMVPLDAGGAAADDGAATWRDSLTVPRSQPEERRRAAEAQLVARAIRELIDADGCRPGDVMVLCRKRQSLRFAAEALRSAQLPYLAVEDHDLLDAPMVRDLLALLDVLASPGHNLSLAHALRSPMFGASDDDLITLATHAGAGGDWWAALLGPTHASPALARAAELLRCWADEARDLPPHDLLDRIVHAGQFRERAAAAVPAEQTAAALDAIDALLEQSLTLDGGRYATPYNFVRALRKRCIRVAAPAHADAVQLLTIHGAKGLESNVVFIMDTKPEAAPTRTATVLVDWPVESPAPTRCAFLYSESRCPVSLRAPLELEWMAREREELNGLYVAMTRAQERLVISATAPSRAEPRPSWWDRLLPLAQAWSPRSAAPLAEGANVREVVLAVLPSLHLPEPPGRGHVPPQAGAGTPGPEGDDDVRRLGRAVHCLLEWAADRPVPERREAWAAMCRQAAREFHVGADEVSQRALVILESPQCAPFFSAAELAWAGNEVTVSDGDELLRIDRLVRRREGAAEVWWVLDYKLAHAPEELPAYREQLLRYRGVITRLEAPAAVRCAFITGDGRLIEIA